MMNRYFSGRGLDRFNDGFGGGHMLFGGMFMGLILLALVAVLIYFLVRNHGIKTHTAKPEVKSTDYYINILKENYAKGQLTDEEFEKKVKTLRDSDQGISN
ncbi:MAG: SHOCT domain-containing protein [Eubacteriaceae bacterium]|nr:SHOCT domain-containing protein [Eubacteriaceae bacterium]